MLMQIDGTFVFVIISFLIFLLIIKAILYRPFTKIMDDRNSFYQKNSKMEAESKEKTKTLLKQKEDTLNEAKQDALNIIKQASHEAKIKSKKELKDKIEKNKNDLIIEANQAKQELKTEINSLVKSIVSKVLKQDVDIQLEEEKINQYLNI